MTISRRTRDILAVLAIALASAALFASPLFDRGRGLSLDLLTWLRFETFGVRHDPAESPAVVVGIDEESYHTPPLKGSPLPTWTGEIGHVLSAMLEGGAKVVGFDMVFRESIEQSEIPFGDGTLSLGATIDQDIDPVQNRRARRVMFNPRWLMNRWATIDLNYTSVDTALASSNNRQRSAFATLTLTK